MANNINCIVTIGNFIINQDFIAKTLCIQKDDQQGCHGKCHLKKQLAENSSDSKEKLPLQNSERTSLDIFYILAVEHLILNCTEFELPRIIQIHNPSKITKTSFEVETPPPIFS
ncbi:hypothetical protein [Seonamhaeicola sp.]|uniref:hypothetical protein n=1 Tax=Seonamhaeicola sp. TaxID=1912245 RepID=UPI00261E86EF|nr:hypothetical protein [Seonamhaeicola sp.]